MSDKTIDATSEVVELNEPLSPPEVTAAASWFARRYPNQDTRQLAGYYREHHQVGDEAGIAHEDAYAQYKHRLSILRLSQVPLRPGEEVFDLLPERRQENRRWEEQQHFLAHSALHKKNSGLASVVYLMAGCLILGGGLALGVMGWNKLQTQALTVENPRPFLNSPKATSRQAGMVIIRNQPQSPDRQVKTVTTAGLKVADVAGALNQPIALTIGVDAGSLEQKISLRISGLPQNARLSQGERLANHDWLLNAGEEKNLTLMVPETSEPQLVLTVSGYETVHGTLAAPPQQLIVSLEGEDALPVAVNDEKNPSADFEGGVVVEGNSLKAETPSLSVAEAVPETTLIVPANGPPESFAHNTATAAAQPISDDAPAANSPAATLVVKGDALFQAGELTAARQFYLRAYDQGVTQVALKIAQTYDPTIHQDMQVKGLAADGAQAEVWYQKAKEAEATSNDGKITP